MAVSRRRVLQGLVVSNDASTQELRSLGHLMMSKLNFTVTTIYLMMMNTVIKEVGIVQDFRHSRNNDTTKNSYFIKNAAPI